MITINKNYNIKLLKIMLHVRKAKLTINIRYLKVDLIMLCSSKSFVYI